MHGVSVGIWKIDLRLEYLEVGSVVVLFTQATEKEVKENTCLLSLW
jgi:hypothetical protein